mmetsp:Transcript_9515/g.18418  ORF Transcript_9515/g.18418 Transcript_9515/m.18418 type:complete len:489 (+) Transcript_9515:797-2263(+)
MNVHSSRPPYHPRSPYDRRTTLYESRPGDRTKAAGTHIEFWESRPLKKACSRAKEFSAQFWLSAPCCTRSICNSTHAVPAAFVIQTMDTDWPRTEWERNTDPSRLYKRTDFPSAQTQREYEAWKATDMRLTEPLTDIHAGCMSQKKHAALLKELAVKHHNELEAERQRHLDILSQKMNEFEAAHNQQEKAKVAAYERRLKDYLKLEKELVELRTVVETYRINEELIKKQFEGVIQQSERSAQDYRYRMESLEQELNHVRKTQLRESEYAKNSLLQEVDQLRRDIELQSRDTLKQEEVIMSLNQRLLDREQTIAELEHRVLELQQDRLGSRDYENMLREKRQELEDERRLRQKYESEVRILTEDLNNIRERAWTETYPGTVAEEEFQKESPKFHLESERQSEYKSLSEYKGLTSRNEEGVWKEKSALLATKYYAALRTLRGEVQEVRYEALRSVKTLRTEFEIAVQEVTAKYKSALAEKKARKGKKLRK